MLILKGRIAALGADALGAGAFAKAMPDKEKGLQARCLQALISFFAPTMRETLR